jgi:2-keto-4-pentenoate hydratase
MSNSTSNLSPWIWPRECSVEVKSGLARLKASRRTEAGEAIAGWKIAANDPGMQSRWKQAHCLYGHVATRSCLRGQEEFDLSGYACAAVEPELRISIGTGLTGNETDAGIISAINSIGLAAEIIDIRGRVDDVADVIAGNYFHTAVVLSNVRPTPHAIGPATMLAATRNGELVWKLPALTLLPPFVAIVRFVADALRSAGDRLEAGQFILSGLLTPLPIWVQPGDQVVLSLDDDDQLYLKFHGGAQ